MRNCNKELNQDCHIFTADTQAHLKSANKMEKQQIHITDRSKLPQKLSNVNSS